MNLNEIKELIDKINSSDISYFEVKLDDSYIKMDKSLTRNLTDISSNSSEDSGIKESKESLQTTTTLELEDEIIIDKVNKKEVNDNDYIIKAPMVGTFYESPGVGQNSYVKVGDKIKPGDILCIVEAMKLMNEIECEVSGEIIEILAKDGEMVEYGAELFRVRR